ncbi:alpha/beta fold hydrolase [Prevotella sp. A2931]|uniref:Alpha/beta fold hydrolase n=2 Tax=Prevotellaceae TaxID=171552 RepID=A0ABS3M6W0_9BACT|nr:alpha/beta fold hydrolase [Prevotella illustrans]PTL27317.1 alpha/beta hydrolase [Prevotella sp. oral taxon 820]
MAVFAFQAQGQSLQGDWTGQLELGPQKLSLVFHIDTAGKKVTLDVPEQSATGIPMTVSYLSDDSISVLVPQINMTFKGRLAADTIRGTFIQGPFSKAMICTRGQKQHLRPQEPTPPFPYSTEEVTFTNDKAGVSLSATLTIPKNFKWGKTPVVLFVTGSGPQNRDEELFFHKPFLVIADALAKAGIASLRYDDRGIGKSTGKFSEATTFDFADDAAAGLQYLCDRKEFGKVGLLGHSEGGMIAFILGSRQKTDFIVSLAGPTTRIDTMMCIQINKLAHAKGATENVVNSAESARKMMLAMSPTVWTKAFIDIDMTPYIEKVACPVLHVNGSLDLNVPPELTIPALRRHLPHNRKTLIKEYTGLNHEFQHATTGNPEECVNIEETFAPEVLNDITIWINKL